MEKEEDILFVKVREPNEVRRNILESLKDIVETLHRFEKFRHVRKEKLHSINKLSNELKGINRMLSDLKNAIPETKLREIKIKAALEEKKEAEPKPKKRKHKKAHKEAEEKPKPITEVERLESELGAIEEKLKGLQ